MLSPSRLIEESRLKPRSYSTTSADFRTAIAILKYEVVSERRRTRELRKLLAQERARSAFLNHELDHYRRRACTEGFLLRPLTPPQPQA